MAWVTEHWGLRAVVRAGQSTRDYLREAIQVLSPRAQSRHVFTHTGWREVDGRWVYLMANGAVGGDGHEVDLGADLARYSLPRVVKDPVEAMRASRDGEHRREQQKPESPGCGLRCELEEVRLSKTENRDVLRGEEKRQQDGAGDRDSPVDS